MLKTNKLVHFKLRCRYFIELVRKTDELRQAIESQTKRNGVSADSNSQGMEIDQNGNAGGGSSSAEVLALETEMLEYGQTLQADYSDSTVASGSSGVLDELFSLMAYQHPLQEPQLQHLLDQDGRVVVAEELNVAILCKLPSLVSEVRSLPEHMGITCWTSADFRSISRQIPASSFGENLRSNGGPTRRTS